MLVVDDEHSITELISTAMSYEGFSVDTVHDGASAVFKVLSNRYDIIILDVMLPDLAGVEVCRRIRESGDTTPVLFLTARDATEDKVSGLAAGGDDYVTKPFSLEELVARVQAILRRVALPANTTSRLVFADLVIDEDTHEVWRQGQPIELTPTELNLLKYLVLNGRQVLSKAQILDWVWAQGSDDPNVVETYISYLRKKIDCFDPPLIQTVRGVGYALRAVPSK